MFLADLIIDFCTHIIFKRRIPKMKNYIAPEMDIVLLQVEDIITSSDNEVDLEDGSFWEKF